MTYDYVIVGGGSAGCVLAARLSEDANVSVCLLEAGGGGKGLLIRAPALVAAMVSGRPKLNNWALHTVPQAGLNNRRGFQPRGKALGGSSAINAMLYLRGHKRDYDEWADLGCDGWSWDEVLPYFKRSEGNARGADGLHSADGPLQVADQNAPRGISAVFVDAAQSLQIRRNDDFNGAQMLCMGRMGHCRWPIKMRRGVFRRRLLTRPNRCKSGATMISMGRSKRARVSIK